ncbi:hypothetical protein J416_09414 [Gracilibacillus halophilus YIM-C55.5]|uniref:DUF669 domain-containing protein n=1 Tax=Gracilibacillus halophilus YIM-C55.5 TaxID=1308866 RepID=N4WQH1_9BACI|nr:DUF669 domain-containing protein [Gracilibacillus halophilus]ENH96705.1 hypothetical protein J416_09414 [Gracilibacillus halophilus YIM-C55.5]
MNLKEAAAEILDQGFDPKKDAVGGDFEELPDGLYDMILTDVKWQGPNEKGTEWLSFEFEVLNEGYENRKYFGNIFFSNEKMMQLNLKRAMKSAAVLDVELDIDDFDDEEVLVEKIKEGVGNQCMVELKTNKKGTFQNWEAKEDEGFEVDDDGMPF